MGRLCYKTTLFSPQRGTMTCTRNLCFFFPLHCLQWCMCYIFLSHFGESLDKELEFGWKPGPLNSLDPNLSWSFWRRHGVLKMKQEKNCFIIRLLPHILLISKKISLILAGELDQNPRRPLLFRGSHIMPSSMMSRWIKENKTFTQSSSLGIFFLSWVFSTRSRFW